MSDDKVRKGVTPERQDEMFRTQSDGEIHDYRIMPGQVTQVPITGVSMCLKVDAKGKPTGSPESGLKLLASLLLEADGDSRTAGKMKAGEVEKICGEMGWSRDDDGAFIRRAVCDFLVLRARDYLGTAAKAREFLTCLFTISPHAPMSSVPLTTMQEFILSLPPGTPMPRRLPEAWTSADVPEAPAGDVAVPSDPPKHTGRDPGESPNPHDLKSFFDAEMREQFGRDGSRSTTKNVPLLDFASLYYGVPASRLDGAAVCYHLRAVFEDPDGPFSGDDGFPSVFIGLNKGVPVIYGFEFANPPGTVPDVFDE